MKLNSQQNLLQKTNIKFGNESNTALVERPRFDTYSAINHENYGEKFFKAIDNRIAYFNKKYAPYGEKLKTNASITEVCFARAKMNIFCKKIKKVLHRVRTLEDNPKISTRQIIEDWRRTINKKKTYEKTLTYKVPRECFNLANEFDLVHELKDKYLKNWKKVESLITKSSKETFLILK